MNKFNSFIVNNKNINLNDIIKKALILALLIIIVFTFISNALIIQEDQIVIIKQFGKITKIIYEPGLYFKIPLIQNTAVLSKCLMHYDSQPTKMLTKDKKNIIVDSYTVWKISDAREFIKTVQSVNGAELIIDNAVYSVIRTELGTLSYDEIIKNSSSKGNFNDAMTKTVNEQLSQYGIKIYDVQLKSCYLPPENEDSVYARMKSDREKIAAQYVISGENQAAQIKADADKQVKIILSKAYADADKLKGDADAEAAKVYAQSFNQDPEFYKFVRTLESYKKTLKGKPTIVIPINSPYAKYLLGDR